MIAVSLPYDMETRLRTLASETGKSVEQCLREAAENYLEGMSEDRQDAEDARLIRERVEAWEQQGHPGITLEDYARSRGIGAAG